MKRRYIAILIIGLATWLCACETEMMGYEGESGIYFGNYISDYTSNYLYIKSTQMYHIFYKYLYLCV